MGVRRHLPVALRVIASGIMLGLLLPRVELSSLLPSWDRRAAIWLGLALAVTLLGLVLSTLRWRAVLVVLGLRTRMRTLFGYYLAGQFVGNFLPSTVGGDVLRVARLSAANGERPGSFASVVLERLTGWLVLPVLIIAAMLINPTLAHLGTASTVAVLLAVATLALLVSVVLAAMSPRLGGRLTGSSGWRRFAGAVHLGLATLRSHPAAAAGVLLTGFAYQLVLVLAAYFAALSLGLSVGPTAILAFMPAVAIAQVVPVSLGGLGVREGAFVLFLQPLGVSIEQAIALGLLVYGLNLVVSLLGAPAFAAGSRGADPTPARALA
jgi:glycosyltransferase 2 family protein